MTANGVTSVSLDPPMALVCVGHNRNTYGLIKATGRYGMSVLSATQEHVARHFTLPPEHRPESHSIRFAELGMSPVVEGAIAAMDCRIVLRAETTRFLSRRSNLSVVEGRFGSFTSTVVPSSSDHGQIGIWAVEDSSRVAQGATDAAGHGDQSRRRSPRRLEDAIVGMVGGDHIREPRSMRVAVQQHFDLIPCS